MTTPTTTRVELVRRLHELETRATPGAIDDDEIAARVYQKIYLRLPPLLGAIGTRALSRHCTRAAAVNHPALAPMEDGTDGPTWVDGVRDVRALTVLTATLLDELTTMIGDRLTEAVVSGAWPDAFEEVP